MAAIAAFSSSDSEAITTPTASSIVALLVIGVEDGDGVAVGYGNDGTGDGVGMGGELHVKTCAAPSQPCATTARSFT